MASSVISTLGNCAINQPNRCVLHRGCNMPTKFGKDWSTSNELATVLRNSIWRQPPSWLLIIVLVFDMTDAFYIGFATFQPKLMRIGSIAKKLKLFFKIVIIVPERYCAIFGHIIRVLHRIYSMPTKFGDDWSISDELATVFLNSIWRQPPSWILIIVLFSTQQKRSTSNSQHSHQVWWELVK